MGYNSEQTAQPALGIVTADAWRQRIRAEAIANYHYEMGVATRAKEELAAAEEHFRRAVEALPDMAQAHFRLIQTLRALGQPDHALQAERYAAAACPDYGAQARYRIALDHFAHGRYSDAEAALRSALDLQPGHGPAHLLLLATAAVQDKQADTAALLAETQSVPPVLSAAAAFDLFDAGQTLLRAGRWAPALRLMEALDRTGGNAGETGVYRGLAMIGCGSVMEGLAALRGVPLRDVTMLSGLPRDLLDMAQQLSLEGRPVESMKMLQLSALFRPDEVRTYQGIGYTLLLAHQWPAALAALDRALLLNPYAGPNYALRGLVLQAMGQFEDGVAATRRAVEFDPSLPTRYTHVAALQNAGHLEEAETVAARGHAEDTLPARGSLYLTQVKLARRDLTGAERVARQALEKEPSSARLRANLGLTLHATGKQAEAVTAYRDALKGDHVDNWVQSTAGLAPYLEGKFDEAVAMQEQAVAMFAFSAWALVNAGLALNAAGRRTEARDMFARALEAEPQSIAFQVRLRPWAEAILRDVYEPMGLRMIA